MAVLRASIILTAMILIASCSPTPHGWAWTEWGVTDSEVAARSQGRVGLAHLEEPQHLQIKEPRLVSEARIQQDGRWFQARFEFNPRDRKLEAVGLRLTGSGACVNLLRDTRARHGMPDRILKSKTTAGGMFIWTGGTTGDGFMINNRTGQGRFEPDCILIYTAPKGR